MDMFNGILSIHGVSFLMLSVIAIAALGYILGRITIKGISLGTAGVFIVALIYGCIFYKELSAEINTDFVGNALKIVDNLGLILFVTAVGFIAGPNFFGNFKKNFKSYVILAIIIIFSGGLACAGCILVGRNFTDLSNEEFTAMLTGILSGALTSTPGFSAAKDAVGSDAKLTKADMAKERELLAPSSSKEGKEKKMFKLIEMDSFGIMPFAMAAFFGIIIGSFKFGNFSLSTTGGCLLVSLIMGHFGHIGKFSVMPKDSTLKVFRELGLMFFLIGAGVSGGAKFVQYFDALYFVYGMIMTVVPMIIGFLFAKYVLKLSLLNNLGSITGGMTSTPALGTLISTAGTENVASAYAATYPVALISVVLVSQFLIILFK